MEHIFVVQLCGKLWYPLEETFVVMTPTVPLFPKLALLNTEKARST